MSDRGTVRSAEVARLLGVSQRSALNELRRLVDAGLVVADGANRNRVYRRARP